MVIKGYRVGPLLRKVGREIADDNVPGMAAQTAFYFFSSIFPLFLFIAPLLSLVGDRNAMMTWIVGQLQRVVPADALAVVQNVVRDVVFAPGAPGLMSIGLLGAAWAGSNVFGALVDSLVFPTIAFGGFLPWITLGQFAAKVAGGFLWSLVLGLRKRERVSV